MAMSRSNALESVIVKSSKQAADIVEIRRCRTEEGEEAGTGGRKECNGKVTSGSLSKDKDKSTDETKQSPGHHERKSQC